MPVIRPSSARRFAPPAMTCGVAAEHWRAVGEQTRVGIVSA
jgi:hypothetical protein